MLFDNLTPTYCFVNSSHIDTVDGAVTVTVSLDYDLLFWLWHIIGFNIYEAVMNINNRPMLCCAILEDN